MNIHELQTHKWVIPIKENLDLPVENQGYLMVREMSPMKVSEYSADAVSDDQSKQMQASKRLFLECVVGVHNITGTDSEGKEYEIKKPSEVIEELGTRLFQELVKFIQNPTGEEEVKN